MNFRVKNTHIIFCSYSGFLTFSLLTRQRSLKGILIDELIHKMGRIPQSLDGNRHKIENRICIQWVNKYHDIGTVIESVELSDTD